MSHSMIFAPEISLLLRRGSAILLAGLLLGCGPAHVVVEGSFPAPLMEKLPLTLGVWYDEEFANHEFFDEAVGRNESSWMVTTGQAQVEMWDTLLDGMFEKVIHMKGKPGGEHINPEVDAVLVPHIDELQYAIPAHTNVKVYEIWMRYRMQLLTNSGEHIAQWMMTAYGKTPTAFMQSDQAAVNLAAVMALRDAGANFATTFSRVPEVQEFLQQKQGNPQEAIL